MRLEDRIRRLRWGPLQAGLPPAEVDPLYAGPVQDALLATISNVSACLLTNIVKIERSVYVTGGGSHWHVEAGPGVRQLLGVRAGVLGVLPNEILYIKPQTLEGRHGLDWVTAFAEGGELRWSLPIVELAEIYRGEGGLAAHVVETLELLKGVATRFWMPDRAAAKEVLKRVSEGARVLEETHPLDLGDRVDYNLDHAFIRVAPFVVRRGLFYLEVV